MKWSFLGLFLLISLTISTTGHAEICKIVDANGRVSYKEMKTCGENAAIKVRNNSFTLAPLEALQEIPVYNLSVRSRELVLTDVSYFADEKFDKPKPVGRYLFGAGCTGSASMHWPKVLNDHANFFPSKKDTLRALKKALQKQGYLANVTNASYHRVAGSMFVSGNMVDMTLEACAEKAKPGFTQADGEDYKAHLFNKSRISMKIEWTLRNYDKSLIGIFTTEGVYDSASPYARKNQMMNSQFTEAIKASLANLLEKPELQEHFMGKPPKKPLATPSKPPEETFSFQSKILIFTIGIIILLVALKRFVDI